VNRRCAILIDQPWAPYAVAGGLLLIAYVVVAGGLSHMGSGYSIWGLDHHSYSDVLKLSGDHYLRTGRTIRPVPYLHDRIEYPVLLGFALWLPSWLPGGPATWLAAAGAMTAGATFASIALIRRRAPRMAWWIAGSPALLLDAGVNWDLVGIVFFVAAIVWFDHDKLGASGGAAAIGTFFKLFPVVVVPMVVACLGARWRSKANSGNVEPLPSPRSTSELARWSLPFGVVSIVVMVPFLLFARSNVLWFFHYNSTRTEKDSVWGLVGRLFGHSLSAHFIDDGSLVIVALSVVYGVWLVWQTAPEHHGRAVALASSAVLVTWMATNKVWNPQYVLWVFAAGACAALPARFGLLLGAVSVYDYWFEFILRVPDHAGSFSVIGYGATVARTLLFGAMAVRSLRVLRRLGNPVGSATVASAA
jgi:hypothetical protein